MSKTIQSCLSSDVLELIERNDVSPDELIAIEEHVSECPRCRELFDSHYTSSQWSELIQPALSDAQLALTSVTEDGVDHSAAILKLLGPTDDPNMLGRIGNYEIVGVIGQGGMGAVFKGFDRSLSRFVAIKMLLPHLAASGAARKRFAREGQAVAAVVDDHVMAIHCVDQWQGIPYLVMTYSRGVSLQKRLNDSGPLELREILRIGMQAAKGLAAAHAQGIVHRDIKPSNILLDQNVERVQLVDFGLARAVDDASLTCSGTLAGTPQYMSPEQARAETVDHRSDLFSLGSVLYAMCAGYAPFRADSSYSVLRLIIEKEPRSIREINSDIPDWLCAIIGKLMAKQAVDRFDSAKQVAELLEACLAHVQQPTTVPLPSSVAELVSLGSSTSGGTQTQAVPNADLRKKTWHRFVGPPIGKYLAAALAAAAMILAGVVIVLELDKGTLTIKSVADNVPIRILQGKDTVQELTVSKQGTTTRLRAGTYTVEIEADSTAYEIQGDNVTVKRGEEALVEISIGKSSSSSPSNEHLVNGIQWSTYGANDGLLSGARLILGTSVSLVPLDGGVYPGQPVAVEYRLKNVSTETKKLIVYIRGNREHIAIGKDNRITDAGITTADEPTSITIEPGKEYVATSHRASIETHGLAPGIYQVALGSAFFYPDKADPSSKHEIPHRGSISFEILQPDATISRPLSQDIHWGKSVSGLRLGAKFRSKSNNFAIGSIVEADLWIANDTKQAIECSILLPHPMDGWLFNIENHLGSTIMLERPPRISIFHPQEFFAINLAPGEVRQITGEPIEGQPDKFAGRSAKFEIVNTKENQGWGDHTIKGRLVADGGDYSAIFDVTLQRPDIPKMRIELDSGNCPFTVGKPDSDSKAARVIDEATVSDDPLTAAIDRFNKRMRDADPYNQPPLTKDELIAYASWNMERGDKLPATCKAGLTKIAKQHRLPENWTIDGFYGETSNGGEHVLAFQIFLQTDDNPAIQMVIRRRFLSPPKDYSLSTATNSPGVNSLAAAVKRFNARHSQAAGIEQPPLTEDEVVAAVLYTKARRDDHDVSDALFERFQNIARTRQLPEGATLEVIPTFGVEGGSTYTIWSIRLTMLQNEPDIFGRTYGFLIREQFVSVKHGDAGSIHWGKPAENGFQAGVRLSPALKSYQLGQKIDVELLYRNVLTKPLTARLPNLLDYHDYDVEAYDGNGTKIEVFDTRRSEMIVGGFRVAEIGEEPICLRARSVFLMPSRILGSEEDSKAFSHPGIQLIFIDPGKSCRLQFTVINYASDVKSVLKTGFVEFEVDATASLEDETGVTPLNGSKEKAEQLDATLDDPLAQAVDRFNERMLSTFLFHSQPPLTKDELVACATWYMERHNGISKADKDGVAKIAKQQLMPDKWTIEGEYSDLSPVLDPTVVFQIYLQTDSPNERLMIRRRFLWPSKDQSPSPATTDQVGGTSLAIAIKQFNARHSHVGGQQQPRLTMNEVVAAILHNQTERDKYAAIGVSDELLNRFQNIARTRLLPEGATLELIPTPAVEGGSTFTIWTIGLAMLGDKGHEGRTTTFEIRQQFVAVKQGDRESKGASSTQSKGKAERVINGWPVPDTLAMPSFPKELHGKWRIQNAITLTTKKTEFINQVAEIDQNTVLLPSGDQRTQYRLSHWHPRDDNQSIEVDLTMESTDEKDSKTYRCLLEIHGDELILLRQQNESFSRPKSVDDISTSITRFTLLREKTSNKPMVYSPLEAIEVAKRFANVDHGKSIGVKFRVESVHPPFGPSEEDELGHTKSELHLDFRPLPANFKDDQFLVVLTPEAITQLNKLGISDIEKHFLHKEVEAHGRVLSAMYTARGMPGEHFHLIVRELQQIAFSKVQPAPENTLPNRCNVEIVEFDRLKLSQLGIELDTGDVDSQGSPISLENVEGFRAIAGSLEEKGLAVKILSVSKRIASGQSSTMTEKIDPREFNLSLLPHIKPDVYTADLELRVTQPDLTRPEKTRTRSVEFDCEGKLDETLAMDVTKLFSDDSKSKLVILLLTIEQ